MSWSFATIHHLDSGVAVLIASSIIALILRFLQKRFPKKDPVFIERFIVATCAGLFLLIAIAKLLDAPALAPLSIPYALAAFTVSVFHRGYGTVKISNPYRVMASLSILAVIAFFSSMHFGMAGVLVVIPTLFMFPHSD
jgi:hypothetical protein